MRQVWWNGKLIPELEARVSIYDSALLFGDCVFEMTRSFNRKQFKLKEHLERLMRSVRYVRIPLEMTIDELRAACYEVIDANDPEFELDDEHRLMINITRGLLSTYKDVDIPKGPNVIISDFPLRWTTAGMGKLFDTGINCVIPSQRAIPASLLEPKVKSRSRMHYLMANIEVAQHKGENNWALMLDPDGFITEGPGYNFFIVKDDVIQTPEGRNVLRGISRGMIDFMYCIDEINIEPYDVYEAEEAFVTATPFCILPVVSLNGIPIGDGIPGKWFKNTLRKWGEMVGVDIKAQIQAWDRGGNEGASTYSFK